MKGLLISPFYDGSGWSQASLDLALALYEMPEIDLVCRSVRFNNTNGRPYNFIQKCEKKDLKNIDFSITFATPENLFYDSRLGKNIAYSFLETDTVFESGWPEKYNMMDEIWCSSEFVVNSLIRSGVKVPVRKISIPVNILKYSKKYPCPKEIEKDKEGDFLFYTIADFNHRKNLGNLITAFYSEFDYNEPVNLVIKCSQYQLLNSAHDIKGFISLYQRKSGKKIIKDAIIIDDSYISNEEVYGIHQNCDIFVLASRGEGWCIPCIDALAFGKTPIVPNYGSFLEYMTNENGWLIDCVEEPCSDMADFPCPIYKSSENWCLPLQSSLRKCLREAYSQGNSAKKQAKNASLSNLSIENIQSQIRKALNYGTQS